MSSGIDTRPTVLFACVHNAGRSQMAAAIAEAVSDGAIRALSAGSEPAAEINPAAVEAMAEIGIDLTGRRPRLLDEDAVVEADAVVTMGCGEACPVYPGKRYEDWEVADPAGRSLDEVRPIRDEIERRVRALCAELAGGGG